MAAATFCRSPSSFRLRVAYAALFAYSFIFLPPLADSVHFRIPRFDSGATSILLSGDAEPSNGALQLTHGDDFFSVGHAIYAEKVPLWDSDSGNLNDFTTRFSFIIDTLGRTSYGDALSFFLADPVGYQIPPNSGGLFLGLYNRTTGASSPNRIIHVEFDPVPNPGWDPPFQHVGINQNSVSSVKYTTWNASLHSGETANALISYSAATKKLNVFWSYGAKPTGQENTTLSFQVDLKEALPQWVIIGFSASNGVFTERHILSYWEFNSTVNITESTGKWKRLILLVGLMALLGVLLVGCVAAYGILGRRQKRVANESSETVSLTSMSDDLIRGAAPRRFSYSTLASATNEFSYNRKLGEGGFGCVYRGYLTREDMVVAVKKISSGSKQGKEEYIAEVTIISSLRHRNLVQLRGWCHDQNQFLLVYEYMPNGSLDHHLFGKRKAPLPWEVRYKIALGLASAVLYLHEEGEQCVVHRDIKPSNVMLDSGFNAKLGDFGLARLMDHELGPKTMAVAGTLGYVAPEYIITGKASKESDVYSFGVVVLEIACGRRSVFRIDGSCVFNLVEWAWKLHGKGELLLEVDERLNKAFDAKQMECLMKVGLWCANPDLSTRPSIRQAIQALNFEAAVPVLPLEIPVPMYHPTPTTPADTAPATTDASTYRITDGGR